jgi:hypothetical protein
MGGEGMSCTDHRCTDGITWCAECNGYGVLTMGGRKYRLRSDGRNIGATAVTHELCCGTGLRICGCVPMDDVTIAILTGVKG